MIQKELQRPIHRLLFGPYTPTPCSKGDWITDELLGLVEVFGWTDGPLSWPRVRQKGPPAPVLTAELARAVGLESEQAVAAWWGVSKALVQRWRRGLGVGHHTEGTRQRLRESNAEMPAERRAKCSAALTTPAARENQALGMVARRGKPAPDATRAALLRGARKPKTKEWAAKANEWMLAGKARMLDAGAPDSVLSSEPFSGSAIHPAQPELSPCSRKS